MQHIHIIAVHQVEPTQWQSCVSCAVSCQSACKTSATVGSSLCPGQERGENKVRRPQPVRQVG